MMLKIGVLGAGHLGKIHLKQIKEIPAYNLSGFYDPDPEKTAIASEELGIRSYSSIEDLVDDVDVVDIVTPTLSHYECAVYAIGKNKHVFIEKPITHTVAEAEKLMKLVEVSGLKAQVGHVERFNPAFVAAQDFDLQPVFIESHRISQYNPRGTDVPVVLDLMIHDIDIVLTLFKSEIKSIQASGVPIISSTPDIANARVEFENGAVANLTASRIALKNERKMRLFQPNTYINIDFLVKNVSVYQIREVEEGKSGQATILIDSGNGHINKAIDFIQPKIPEINAIRHELSLFADSIVNDTEPVVTFEDGFRSLKLAHSILEKINEGQKNLGLIKQ